METKVGGQGNMRNQQSQLFPSADSSLPATLDKLTNLTRTWSKILNFEARLKYGFLYSIANDGPQPKCLLYIEILKSDM